jgi:hypothetical protein
MTTEEASNLFEILKSQHTRKSDIKVYEKFLHILTGLKLRHFSKYETQSIETELDSLKLNPNNRTKHIKKALSKFEKYLKESFSLTTKGHYANLYSGLGLSIGLLFGMVFLSHLDLNWRISLSLMGGLLVGYVIGKSMDSQAEIAGKTL